MVRGRVRPWALASGLTGIAGNLALVLFYALATPWEPGGRLEWPGPLNDVLVLAQFVLLAVVLGKLIPGVENIAGFGRRVVVGMLAGVGVLAAVHRR